MKCLYFLDDKKCSLAKRLEQKKGLSVDKKNYCLYYEGVECLYYEEEDTYSFDDIENQYNEYDFDYEENYEEENFLKNRRKQEYK